MSHGETKSQRSFVLCHGGAGRQLHPRCGAAGRDPIRTEPGDQWPGDKT